MISSDISFSMSEEQNMMKETIARLIRDIITDNAHQMDESADIPDEYLQKFWDIGTVRSSVPEEYGGYGMDYSAILNTIILEELAFGDMGFAVAACLPSVFLNPVLEMGTDEQKTKYIPQYCQDKYRPCTLALCEPRFKFDPVCPETKAVRKNGSYIINGKKCFVPYAKESGHILVSASLEDKNNLFIVSSDNPGVEIGEREKNLGLYPLKSYEIILKDCEVPADDRLGGESGCDYSRVLQKSRIAAAAIGAGVSRASFEYARDYSKERTQFGEPVAHRQSVAFIIAEMAYETDAIRLLAWKAASLLEAGKDAARESYLAKLYAGDMTMKITDYGVQVLGGHGYIRDHPVERFYRNGRGIAILEGVSTV